ncbi:hypothetical protein SAMN05660477_00852 [Soonwooa buanensis]|uniref:Uncharacterized protein n=1 Tax=Soonwooa buanensis TaxID=619805 RepID=A0A1T5DMR2_9FLAO|nr:hypothetical protein SAMN05660477_00852 [Soonwooa buanensis]
MLKVDVYTKILQIAFFTDVVSKTIVIFMKFTIVLRFYSTLNCL